jgi:hypothetical protein
LITPRAGRRRAYPADPDEEALSQTNRGGRDKPGHDSRDAFQPE